MAAIFSQRPYASAARRHARRRENSVRQPRFFMRARRAAVARDSRAPLRSTGVARRLRGVCAQWREASMRCADTSNRRCGGKSLKDNCVYSTRLRSRPDDGSGRGRSHPAAYFASSESNNGFPTRRCRSPNGTTRSGSSSSLPSSRKRPSARCIPSTAPCNAALAYSTTP